MTVALIVMAALAVFVGLPLAIARRLDRVSSSYPAPRRLRHWLRWRRRRPDR